MVRNFPLVCICALGCCGNKTIYALINLNLKRARVTTITPINIAIKVPARAVNYGTVGVGELLVDGLVELITAIQPLGPPLTLVVPATA
jgi:hypothetical protein